MAIFVGVALVASFVWPTVAYRFLWVFVPAFGAFLWRLERAPIRVIASWTVPLAIGLFVADRLPRPADTIVSALGVAILVAMMYWDTARDGWVKFVAPGTYRVFGRRDRATAEAIAILDLEAIGAIERFTHDGDDRRFRERLERVRTKARDVSVPDAEWLRVRDAFVDWLSAGIRAAVDRGGDRADDPHSFAEFEQSRTTYETARDRMADARAHTL